MWGQSELCTKKRHLLIERKSSATLALDRLEVAGVACVLGVGIGAHTRQLPLELSCARVEVVHHRQVRVGGAHAAHVREHSTRQQAPIRLRVQAAEMRNASSERQRLSYAWSLHALYSYNARWQWWLAMTLHNLIMFAATLLFALARTLTLTRRVALALPVRRRALRRRAAHRAPHAGRAGRPERGTCSSGRPAAVRA